MASTSPCASPDDVPGLVEQLVSMGFDREKASVALAATDGANDVSEAANMLLAT